MSLTVVDRPVGAVAFAADSETSSDPAGHCPDPRPRRRASADVASVRLRRPAWVAAKSVRRAVAPTVVQYTRPALDAPGGR